MEENELKLTTADKTNLLETTKWGKFLAIVGLIMSAMIVLLGLFMIGGVGGAFDEVYPGIGGSIGGVGFIYILFSLLYILPSLYLLRFSNKLKRGITLNDQESCSQAFTSLKRLFLFMGVLTIVVLSLYGLAILFMIMGGVMGGML
jgi:hypothetical protein